MKKLIKFIKFQKKTNKRFSNRGKLYKIVIKEKLCIYFKDNIFLKRGSREKWGIIKKLF